MKKILVSELKPGMKFTQAVYIDRNNILVGPDVPVKESDIKRLLKWDIREVESDGEIISAEADMNLKVSTREFDVIIDNYNKMLDLKERLVNVHEQACLSVTKAYTAIRNNRVFTTNELESSVDAIYRILAENSNVFLFIHSAPSNKDVMTIHAVNTTFYSLLIAMAMKYPKSKIRELGVGALMINAGMVQIPAYIMHKQSDLLDREMQMIRSHPVLGYKVVKELGNISEYSASISLQHHEQYDGGGYPKGLRATEISEQARIVAIADSYEALVEKRSYRDKQFFYQAMKQW